MSENVTGTSLSDTKAPRKKPLQVARLEVRGFDGDEQATGATLGPIYAIHRGPSGVIPVATKNPTDGTWDELGVIDPRQPEIPGLTDRLDTDAYFGVNTSFGPWSRLESTEKVVTRDEWRPIPGEYPGQELFTIEEIITSTIRRTINPKTGLKYSKHTNERIKWLNVCYVDIDCYKVGLTAGQAFGAVIDLQDNRTIPPVTMFGRSGRGLWLMWFLIDGMNPPKGERIVYKERHRPDTPQRKTKRAVAFYAKIQRALADKLKHLGADLGACDMARFAPVPGTLKTAADQRVTYWVQFDSKQRSFFYTLWQLADALGVSASKTAHPVIMEALPDTTRQKNPALSGAGKRGWLVRWQNALGDFETIRNLRGGGFDRGIRNRAAFFYGLLLTKSGMSPRDAEAHVREFGRQCRPQLSEPEIAGAMKNACKPKGETTSWVTNGTLLAELEVTEVEASYLQFLKPKPKPLSATASAAQTRRTAILQFVKQLGFVPACREMTTRYLQPNGFADNHSTVWRDYKALGLIVPKQRAKGGRPPKLPYC